MKWNIKLGSLPVLSWWPTAPIFLLVFSLARSNSLFLHCFSSSYFLPLTWAMVGHVSALLSSILCHCLQFGLKLDLNWPGESRHCACVRRADGRTCMRVTDTSQTRPLALIGCVDPGEADSCKSKYSHWVEPQTADLHLILLSNHNDNFSKYNQIDTD